MWTLEDKFHISARPCIIRYFHLNDNIIIVSAISLFDHNWLYVSWGRTVPHSLRPQVQFLPSLKSCPKTLPGCHFHSQGIKQKEYTVKFARSKMFSMTTGETKQGLNSFLVAYYVITLPQKPKVSLNVAYHPKPNRLSIATGNNFESFNRKGKDSGT